ncbi:hypothetical protein P7C70_g6405, partial [Phenoliferia sp. Uapishka_3]
MTTGKTAIIFGANGVSGSAAIRHLLSQHGWSRVIATSLRPVQYDYKDPEDRLRFVSMDQTAESPSAVADKLRSVGGADVSLVLFYTYIAKDDEDELISVNQSLFQGGLDAIDLLAKGEVSFVLQTGYKRYNVHRGWTGGLSKIPYEEDSPRPPGKNFYFIQEDMLKEFCEKRSWQWNIVVPNFVLGVTKGNFMNLVVSLGIYASLRKALNEPLVWPGNSYSWNCVNDMSSAANNVHFATWVGTNPKAANQVFNITDGGKPARFEDLWPQFASNTSSSAFGLESEVPFDSATPPPTRGEIVPGVVLEDYLADKKPVWNKLVKEHGLDPKSWDYATWPFLQFVLSRTWPDEGSNAKARSFGWDVTYDTLGEFEKGWEEMRTLRIIP